MKSLIVLFGAKQSGKTTSATAIYGMHLVNQGILPNANFDTEGKMTVVYDKETNKGVEFDIDSSEDHMVGFMKKNVWAHIKHTNFADALKKSCAQLFGIDEKLMWGTNEDKESKTHIQWESLHKLLPQYIDRTGPMSVREILEVFGTDICREFDINCHIRSAKHALDVVNPTIGVIPDGRFYNEFEYFENLKKNSKGGPKILLIKHKRKPHKSSAKSENGLDGIDDSRFDLVLDNVDLSVNEKNGLLIDFLIEQGVLSEAGVEIV